MCPTHQGSTAAIGHFRGFRLLEFNSFPDGTPVTILRPNMAQQHLNPDDQYQSHLSLEGNRLRPARDLTATPDQPPNPQSQNTESTGFPSTQDIVRGRKTHSLAQHFSRLLHSMSSLSQEARHPHPGNVGMPRTWASSSPIGGSCLCSEVSVLQIDDMWATCLNVHLSYNLISPFSNPKYD